MADTEIDLFGPDTSTFIDELPSSDLDENFVSDPKNRGDFIEEASITDPPILEEEEEPKSTPEPDEPLPQDIDGDPETPPVEPEKKPPAEPRIPKSRLDEEIAARRIIEAENEALRRRILGTAPQPAPQPEPEPEPEYDFAGKQKEIYDAILDGNRDKAWELQQELDTKRTEIIQQQTEYQAEATLARKQEEVVFNRTVQELQTRFELFNPEAPTYDEELTNEVVVLRDALAYQHRIPRHIALARATYYVLSARHPELLKQAPAADDTAPPAPPAPPARQNSRKSVEAESLQPPVLEGEGNSIRDQDKIDPKKMTEEEFDALPDATKRRLRGD